MEDIMESIKIFVGVFVTFCMIVIAVCIFSISISINRIANHLDIQKDCIKQNGEYYCKVENEKVESDN